MPADVAAQLRAMDEADCAASKAGDWDAFARTLAPEFVSIDVVGKRQTREQLLADLRATAPDVHVTGCSTKVAGMTRVGDHYLVRGEYEESGTQGRKAYRTVSRIRDTWRRSAGGWLQTEAVTYELTVRVDGRQVEHRVLPPR